MRQAPQLVNMADLVSSLMHARTGLIRPTSNAGILSRIKLAWLVFIGDCDALKWGAWKASADFNKVKDMSKLRTPTKTDTENAERWLAEAQYNLKKNEYHRVKLLCRQTIRALRRKETETPNAIVSGLPLEKG